MLQYRFIFIAVNKVLETEDNTRLIGINLVVYR